MADESALYVCGVYETCVVLGRISQMNKKRAEMLVQRLPGPDREQLQTWHSGTRAFLLATYPKLLADDKFDDADEAYRVNPKNQVEFERTDQ